MRTASIHCCSDIKPTPKPIGAVRRWLDFHGAVTDPTACHPESPGVPPVLADGLFPHTAKFDKELETDVDIPNINCGACTLQIVEFMAAHALNKDGDYTYHHCAVLQIHASPDKPIDAPFPAERK